MFVIDIIVIYPILLTISPIVKYNYEDELVEELNVPLFNQTWKSLDVETTMISKEQIKNYSRSLLFEPDEKQLHQLEHEFCEILNQFEHVASIDTTGYETFDYPVKMPAGYLREDTVSLPDEVSNILKCAKTIDDKLVKAY